MEAVINTVLAEMQAILEPHQLKRLADTLRQTLGLRQPESSQDLARALSHRQRSRRLLPQNYRVL